MSKQNEVVPSNVSFLPNFVVSKLWQLLLPPFYTLQNLGANELKDLIKICSHMNIQQVLGPRDKFVNICYLRWPNM
jgi:hypothetical protein